MTHYNPETGYPNISMTDGEQFDPEDTVTFLDGRTLTGAQANEAMEYWYAHDPRGIQMRKFLDGEGPRPEPLFAIVGDENGGRVYLADSEIDVTEVEPLAGPLLNLLQRPKPIGD